MTPPSVTPFSLSGLLEEPLRSMLTSVEPAIQKLFAFDRLRRVYDQACSGGDESTGLERLLRLLDITCEVEVGRLQDIPATGPVVVVANHPFGLLEAAILATLLPRVRTDVRILANSVLASVPELHERCIFVDPYGNRQSVPGNASALKDCLRWLRDGGLLLAFPAGEVSHLRWREGVITDPHWNSTAARLCQNTGAQCVPIFVQVATRLAFQFGGTLHAGLRTASLPREFLNKRGRHVRIRIGRAVSPETLRSFANAADATGHLRCRTYSLATDQPVSRIAARVTARLIPPVRPKSPDRTGAPGWPLADEIDRLPEAQRLCESGDLRVVIGSASELPGVVREIGRLREIAFRAVGEGTGRSLDLDRFDNHYLHLVLWDDRLCQVAGAYRLGPTPDILPRFGIRGLYTATLFRYDPRLFDALGPALELGRSFVRPEYQKQFAPLFLLWKGIGRYVARRPECGTLFGAVSISSSYHPISRHIIVRFLEAHRLEHLVPLVLPRKPYRADARLLSRTGIIRHVPEDLENASALVADLESDRKGLPILVKQYLKSGGKVLGFNLDPGFSNALDALIVVDLRRASDTLLNRYLGAGDAAVFKVRHGMLPAAAQAPAFV